MFEFFDTILGFITSIWEFVLSWIGIYAFSIKAIVEAVSLPIFILPYLPAIIGGAVYLVICICIVKFFLGR